MTIGNRSPGTEVRAVLWDVDGTLLDSAELHYLAWRNILAREHFELTVDLFRAYFGRRNDAVLHRG